MPESTLMLKAGGYGFAIEHPAIQHKYVGGGHGGCGGCLFALEFTGEARKATFVLYEYRTDVNGQRHRWFECDCLETLLASHRDAWGFIGGKPEVVSRFCEWDTSPPWFYRKPMTRLEEHVEMTLMGLDPHGPIGM